MIFPAWISPILDTISGVGLLFFLFLVGLKLDLHCIRRSSHHAFAIATAVILLPFLPAVGVIFLLYRTILSSPSNDVGFYPFLVFISVALSITAFPILARILAELKLLTTVVSEITMATAAFNDIATWVLLTLAVALSSGSRGTTPLVSLWIILFGYLFVVFMMTAAWIIVILQPISYPSFATSSLSGGGPASPTLSSPPDLGHHRFHLLVDHVLE